MQPRVIDLYHGNPITSDAFERAANAGIWAVIHKATQGTSITDNEYADRRLQALDAGLLWGAYHFNGSQRVSDQVDHFLSVANPDSRTLLCLDFEDYAAGAMSIQEAVQFCELVEKQTHKPVVIYSGNRLKDKIGQLSTADTEYITSKRLWLAQYSSKPTLPSGFKSYWIWQYTGDGIGNLPHTIDGFNNGNAIDLNVYDGTQDQLTDDWYSWVDGFCP